jgi:hypothetical protein
MDANRSPQALAEGQPATLDQGRTTLVDAPWTQGGNWTLWGPTRSETVQAGQVELMVFRMTGEFPSYVKAVDGPSNYLIRTPSNQWVFGIRHS